MENDEYKLKCRAIFYYTLSNYYGFGFEIDQVAVSNFISFVRDNFFDYYKEFRLILYFKNMFEIYENQDTVNKLVDYLKTIDNSEKLSKLYDDVGFYNVNRISNLAYEYVIYLGNIINSNVSSIKQ